MARPVPQILEECCTLGRELAAAAPNERRREIAIRATTYLELMLETSRKKEIQVRINRCRRLVSTEELIRPEEGDSADEETQSAEEGSVNDDLSKTRSQINGIGPLEEELGRLGFV
ncbi:hypothetical protein R1flu_016299 [Riccia fluitans]|uniref:Uncharacterized protein n=1 Tax=Riccia fluitans TaxID=41844 RepID=A0ABD1YM08_9MARC